MSVDKIPPQKSNASWFVEAKAKQTHSHFTKADTQHIIYLTSNSIIIICLTNGSPITPNTFYFELIRHNFSKVDIAELNDITFDIKWTRNNANCNELRWFSQIALFLVISDASGASTVLKNIQCVVCRSAVNTVQDLSHYASRGQLLDPDPKAYKL